MTTAHKGGAIRKHMAQRGYAGGGLLDTLKSAVGMQTSKQVMDAKVDAEMRKRERHGQQQEPAAAPAVAAASAPTDIFSKTLKRREAEAGLKNGGAIKGPAGAIRNLAQKKSPEGAKLKGPGTATSDSIPAVVVDTGEPINVATDERIASKMQNKALESEAKTQGYKDLDDKLEEMTGQPVGPTIKYTPGGKVKAAAAGMAPQDDLQLKSATPTSPYQQMDAKANDTGVAPGVVGDAPSPAGIMGSTGQTAPISNIPGYTPGMIQRSGMGLVGGQQVEGPSAMVPRREGDVSFSKGGAIRRKMMPGRGSDPHGIRMGAPGAGRGPIRAMADGASPEDLRKGDAVDRVNALGAATQSTNAPMPTLAQIGAASAPRSAAPAAPASREALVEQIPTGGAPGAGPTPATNAVRTGGAIRMISDAAAAAPSVPTPAAPAAPVQATAAPSSPGGAVRPTTAPASPGNPATLMGETGKNVGYGVTRFDVAGKSPLFTNVTDGAGMASNEKLINRGPVSEQNLGALAGIQKRQDIGDLARAQKAQYDAEVAGADKINNAPPVYDREAGVRLINDLTSQTSKAISNLSTRDRFGRLLPGNQQAIDAIIKQTMGDPREVHVADQKNRADTYRTDVLREGNHLSADATRYTADSNAGVQRARDQSTQEKLALEERKVNADLQQKARIEKLDDLIINGNPMQQKMAANQKAALMGKGMESGDGKPLNDTQSKALLFGSRMQASNEIFDKLSQAGKEFSTPGANGIAGGLVNLVNSKEGQQLDQAKRDFLNATLRRESGAVIGQTEFDNGNQQYFPQIGDAPEVIAQKRQNRLLAQQAILAEVPNSESRVSQVRNPQGQSQPAAANQPAQPTDAVAYAALPSGATYMTPSGEVRRKK